MPIPLLSLRSTFRSVISLGNSGSLIDPEHPAVKGFGKLFSSTEHDHLEHPTILYQKATRELSRQFSVELTDSEKLNDRAYNDFISNQRAISNYLLKMLNLAIDERNIQLFTKEQMEKHLMQLIERLKEEAFFKKLQENGEMDAYLARLRDAELVERLERELALQEYIKALYEQNRVLTDKRKEHLADFIASTIPLLQEIKPFNQLSHADHAELLSNAFEEGLIIDKEFDLRAANTHANANGSLHPQHANATSSQSAVYQSQQQNQYQALGEATPPRVLTFAHQRPAGIEVEKTAALLGAFKRRVQQMFHARGIEHTQDDLHRGANIILNKFNQAKAPVKQLDAIIERNNACIKIASEIKDEILNINDKKTDLKDQNTDVLDFLDDLTPKSPTRPSKH